MRFLHISDLHLGKTFPVSRYGQQFAHRRRQELLDTFSRLIDFANQNQSWRKLDGSIPKLSEADQLHPNDFQILHSIPPPVFVCCPNQGSTAVLSGLTVLLIHNRVLFLPVHALRRAFRHSLHPTPFSKSCR